MLELTPDHLEYVALYLFSFSKSLTRLQIYDVDKMGTVPLKY
jgi:hypothetical protein